MFSALISTSNFRPELGTNPGTGELKPRYRGTQTPVQGRTPTSAGKDATPRRGKRLLGKGNQNLREGNPNPS